MKLDSQAGLEKRAGNPGGSEAEEASGILKMAVDQAADITGSCGEIFGCTGMAHDIRVSGLREMVGGFRVFTALEAIVGGE